MRALAVCVVLILNATASLAQNPGGNVAPVPKVFDAQGKVIGRLASLSGYEGVYVHVNGAAVFMKIDRMLVAAADVSMVQYIWSADLGVQYLTTDCSGTPVVSTYPSPRPVVIVRKGADVTAYIAGKGYSVQLPIKAMYRRETNTCYADQNTVAQYWTPETAYPLTQRYPEPLTIHE